MRASRLSRYSWTMFDFANQPFYTLIMTFVFSVYFTDVFITGDDGAQKLTLTQTISGLAIAILSPVLGSITDIEIEFFDERLTEKFIASRYSLYD